MFDEYRTRTWAEIDQDAIIQNHRTARKLINPGTELYAVVKANAYGHGARVVAPLLQREGGTDGFAVATPEEAFELRSAGVTRPVLILGHSDPLCFPRLLEAGGILPTLWSVREAKALSDAARGRAAECFLALDTGMGRIGLSCDAAGLSLACEIAALPGLRVAGIFSHLARADERDRQPALAQAEAFRGFCRELEARGLRIPKRSLSNSAAILSPEIDDCTLARQGITLYGLHPSPNVPTGDYRPAMSLRTRVVQVKTVPAGTGISYGHTFVTDRETRVATLAAGYGDGYPRLLSGRGTVLLHGIRCPLIGRICMDMMMADVTALPDLAAGAVATLIGRDGDEEIRADTLAETIGTIGYELVCGISPRVPRIFQRGGRDTEILC